MVFCLAHQCILVVPGAGNFFLKGSKFDDDDAMWLIRNSMELGGAAGVWLLEYNILLSFFLLFFWVCFFLFENDVFLLYFFGSLHL